MDNQTNKDIDLVQGVIFSKIGDYGAEPIYYYPTELDEASMRLIDLKLLSIMTGEEVLAEGIAVIPFPRFKFTGLNYSFAILDETKPEGRAAFFLTLLIKEKNPEFIFQNIDHLTDKLKGTSKILEQHDFRIEDARLQMIRIYKYFIEFSKKYLEIRDSLLLESEKSILTAVLLYFHRKAGPIVFTSYPEEILTKEQSKKLCKELEIAIREGFFSRSYPDISHFSYYFEIPSDWARGKKEMLLLSFVFRKLPAKDITNALHLKLIKFVEKMQVHPEIFKGFYNPSEIVGVLKQEKNKVTQMSELTKQWIKSLYLASIDVFQSSSMEEAKKKSQKTKKPQKKSKKKRKSKKRIKRR